MRKLRLASFVFLAFIACGKKDDNKNPMAPVNPQTDSQEVQDTKKAAQKKENQTPAADDKSKTNPQSEAQPQPAKPGTPGNGDSSPAPTPTPGAPTADTATPAKPEAKTDGGLTVDTPEAKPETKPEMKAEENPDAQNKEAVPEKKDDSQAEAQPQEKKDESQKPEDKTQSTDAQPENKDGEMKENATPGTAPFKFDKSYSGDILTLIHPSENKKNFALIRLNDQDSKKLYETLRIQAKEFNGNEVWKPGLRKHGRDISCYKQESKVSPGTFSYGCSMFLNHSNGTFLRKVSKIKPDPSVPELKEAYRSTNLQLIAPDAKKWGWIQLVGRDAKALFSVLKGGPVTVDTNDKNSLPSQQKLKKNVVCYLHPPVKNSSEPLYACSLNINYETGLGRILNP